MKTASQFYPLKRTYCSEKTKDKPSHFYAASLVCKHKVTRISLLLTALLVVSLSSACDSTVPVITGNGLVKRDAQQSPQFNQLLISFNHANALAIDVSSNTRDVKSHDVQSAYTQMVIDGFALVNTNCADFFRSEGTNQKWAMFGRDLVAAAGTLATAAAAAAGAPSGVTTGFSIATATGYNGLDIYQRNFLFGADNIESVEIMVRKALETDQMNTLSNSRPWIGFGEAIQSIMVDQSICLPASILLLTRTAIKDADIVPLQTNSRLAGVTVAQSDSLQVPAPQHLPSSVKPPLKVPGIEKILPTNTITQRKILKDYINSLVNEAINSKPPIVTLPPDSILTQMAAVLGPSCAQSPRPSDQRDNLFSCIQIFLRDDPSDGMNKIFRKLHAAHIAEQI